MLKAVYVYTGKVTDLYHQMLLISITSLRKHMPLMEVNLVLDENTEKNLKEEGSDALNFQNMKVISVNIPTQYNQVEKSRYLKTSLRTLVEGDFIYIDCDTVICHDFSGTELTDVIGMVLDCHRYLKHEDFWSRRIIDGAKDRGFDFTNITTFYNGGMILVKDTSEAYTFFQEWHECWDNSRRPGMPQDQYSLAVVNDKYNLIKDVGHKWNLQINRSSSLIHLVSEAYIIHYFATNSENVYLLSDKTILKNPVDSEVIQKIIENPKTSFQNFYVYLENSSQSKVINSDIFAILTKMVEKKENTFNLLCGFSKKLILLKRKLKKN